MAATEGAPQLQGAVDGRLHHQLLQPDLVHQLHHHLSPGVLPQHNDLVPGAERHTERSLFGHQGSSFLRRLDSVVPLPPGGQRSIYMNGRGL